LIVTDKRGICVSSIINWVSVILVIVGIGLFLYGANIYDATIGWTGFGLGIFGIVLYIVSYLIGSLRKNEPAAAPTQNP
jgi:membrane-bound ClpP family serine protease